MTTADMSTVTVSTRVMTASPAHVGKWYHSVISIFTPTKARITPSPMFR